jgi:hypothetical protein
MSSSKRHFTVVMRNKEHGLYSSSSPSSAARKAVSKLCADNKNKKVEFYMRETTQLSNKKVYGPYLGYMQKLDKPIELKGRIIRYKPIAKLIKKSRKMKGGVIIGEGLEGVVIKPNINSKNDNQVSKLITATPEEIRQLIGFEEELNKIDKDGKYHVKMLGYRNITSNNINEIPNVNKPKKNEMKKFNFKITYQFGGISIEKFVEKLQDNNKEYVDKVNPHFIQALLRGIVNCFEGLYIFYKNELVHSDLHAGNIVFLLDHPEIMRIIDWSSLLSVIPVFPDPNSPVPNPVPNSVPVQKMKGSLCGFYASIRELLNIIKEIKIDNKNTFDILDEFLKITNFEIYKSIRSARILDRKEFDDVKAAMEQFIAKL